ncbi:hypothetical protein OF83DRAFT_1167849 [Amylostereum chailletii]|nr:hypothetical protein OF83DRAFT_1167849 [Amylostereum chailletii]
MLRSVTILAVTALANGLLIAHIDDPSMEYQTDPQGLDVPRLTATSRIILVALLPSLLLLFLVGLMGCFVWQHPLPSPSEIQAVLVALFGRGIDIARAPVILREVITRRSPVSAFLELNQHARLPRPHTTRRSARRPRVVGFEDPFGEQLQRPPRAIVRPRHLHDIELLST